MVETLSDFCGISCFYCVALSHRKPCQNVKNDLSGTIHSAGFRFCKAVALYPVSNIKFTPMDTANFPINEKTLFFSKS